MRSARMIYYVIKVCGRSIQLLRKEAFAICEKIMLIEVGILKLFSDIHSANKNH